jgi:ATP-binding protein involved in chromosome partitioning
MLTQAAVMEALKAVKYPGYSRDIVSFGLVKEVAVNGDAVSVGVQLTGGSPEIASQLKAECEGVLKNLPGAGQVVVDVSHPGGSAGTPAGGPNPWANQNRVPGVRRVAAIASGKGGVGKSTVSVNLACALVHLGHRVGILDCDIYGPSIPLMMGTKDRPTVSPDEQLVPPVSHGIKLMSMGFLLNDDQPVIWRGPMIVKTIQQFLMQVAWADLDYLLVDLPPGTGDAQLTLCQTTPLDGGLIVTMPQEASLGVVRKGMAMFRKVNVPILGLIENMSYFTAPDGSRVEIFGHGGGAAEAQRQQVPFLGEVPIYPEIRVGGDQGVPVVVSAPDQPCGRAFIDIANAFVDQLP